MSGFRGIFLDSIHPLIVKRLDADTHAFKQMGVMKKQLESKGGDQYEYASTTEAHKYFSERTVWMRVVPFAIPQDIYTLNPNYTFKNSPNGDTPESKYMVPQWRDWVLWGTKSAQIHGGIDTDTYTEPVVPYGNGGVGTGKEHHSSKMFGWGGNHGMYRRTNTAWDGTTRAGVINSPIPGITGMQVSNKGDLGTIRRASFDIKVHNLMDLEAIEMMYMVPGLSVLIEWGWYHPDLFMEPIDIEMIKSGDKLASTNTINTEILKKSFGIQESAEDIGNPSALYNLDERANLTYGPLGPPAGIYDGLLGVATKFNWSNDGQGGYDCRVDCISPGSLAGGIPAESYGLGGSEVIDNQNIPVTDLRTIIAMVKKETRQKESSITTKYIDDTTKKKISSIEKVVNTQDGIVVIESKTADVDIPGHVLETEGYGITITLDETNPDAPTLVYTKSTTKTTDGSGDYYIGEYKGSNTGRQKVSKVYGDRTWWNRLQAYIVNESKLVHGPVTDAHRTGTQDTGPWWKFQGVKTAYTIIAPQLDQSKVGKIFPLAGNDDMGGFARYNIANLEYLCGDALRRGEFAVYSDGKVHIKKDGKWINIVDSGYGLPFDINGIVGGKKVFDPSLVAAIGAPMMEAPNQNDIPLGERTLLPNLKTGVRYNAEQAKAKFGWTGNAVDGYKDKSGQTVVQAGGWGSDYMDHLYVEEQVGVSIYKRTKKDDVYTYTEVASIESMDANDVRDQLLSKAKEISNEESNTAKKELESKIARDAAITATAGNFGAVTWSVTGGKIVAFDDADYHVGIYAKAHPAFAPPIHHLTNNGTHQSAELGYDILESADSPLYPIGVIAYSETYLSWRFVEDYLLNELFMPRAVQPGVDKNNDPKIELDTTFMSANRCTDADKKELGLTFLEKYAGLIEKAEGNLTDSSRNRELYHSQHIINHPSLRSFNPEVCILPGQETLPIVMEKAKDQKDSEEIIYEPKTDIKGSSYMLDNSKMKGAADNISGDTVLNRFAGINGKGDYDTSIGTLRNIMINSDLLEEAASKTGNVRKFVMTVLDKVNKACGEPWKFKILTNSALGKMSIIDENYTPFSNVSAYGEGHTYLDTGDGGVNAIGVYKFSGIGSDNILKDVKIQSKIPSELQTMAYYSTLGANNDKGSEVQMFNMYRAGIVDRLRSISSVTVLGNSTGSEESTLQAEAQLILTHAELLPITRKNQTQGLKANEAVGEGERIAKAYTRKYIHGDTVTVGGYRPPIPIDVNLTMHGVSGIYMGNAIMIKTIDEGGILPSRYRHNVALQATSVDHSIDPSGWTTSIGTLMRPLPDAEYKPAMKVNIKRSAPFSQYIPSDLPIGNPFGSGVQKKVTSQFGNAEAFRKGSHGGLDVKASIGTQYVCCLPNAKVSFRKQTGTKDWLANGALDDDGNPTIGSGVKLANTNGYGYYIRIVGKGFGAAGEKIKYQIDYGHCEGFHDPSGAGGTMDFEEMKAYGKSKGWDVGSTSVKYPDSVPYGAPVGTVGGDRRMKGAGNSLGPHLHMTIKVGGVKQDPQLMVQDYYVAAGGGANDHLTTGGNG